LVNSLEIIIISIIAYLFIGFILGAHISFQKYGWRFTACGGDVIKDFVLKWPKIFYYGIKDYLAERQKKEGYRKFV